MRSFFYVLSAVAIAGGALIGTAAAAAPKEVSFTAKYTGTGSIVQWETLAKRDEAIASVFDETGTSVGNGVERKTHVFGVQQRFEGMAEMHGYSADTDPDGDKVLWKLTQALHPIDAPTTQITGEALGGTGKYAGVSGTVNSSCQEDGSPLGYNVTCDSQIKYTTP